MSFLNDPANNPIDRVRLYTGDIDLYEEGLTDDVYQFVLDKHNGSETKAAIECLRYLVSKYASYVVEKAGGLFVKESEKFEQYKKLLDMYTKDPRTMLYKAGTPFAGGISVSDMEDNRCGPDKNLQKVTLSSVDNPYQSDFI
jgi:hypothetical protein